MINSAKPVKNTGLGLIVSLVPTMGVVMMNCKQGAEKNFGYQQLPFKDFNANAAWYYLMLLCNNLF